MIGRDLLAKNMGWAVGNSELGCGRVVVRTMRSRERIIEPYRRNSEQAQS